MPELHRQRLQRGLSSLRFPSLMEPIQAYVDTALASLNTEKQYAMRITVTRGAGPRGYAPPAEPKARVIIIVTPRVDNCLEMGAPARVGHCEMRWSQQAALAGVKHLNRLEQVLAAAQVREEGWEEGLMLDQQGLPVSVTAGNLFFVEGAQVVTAPLKSCGIEGTRRRWVVEEGADQVGLEARVEPYTLDRLLESDEVFYSNALIGLRPVGQLADRVWQDHPVCRHLFTAYCTRLVA